MTNEEQRAMWREYVRMLMPGDDDTIESLMRTADALLAGERKRFDRAESDSRASTTAQPFQVSAPTAWEGLTVHERERLNLWVSSKEITSEQMWNTAEKWLRDKNHVPR